MLEQRTMNVKKININQSEQTYDITSDAYDITYKDSNVGDKLSELEEKQGKHHIRLSMRMVFTYTRRIRSLSIRYHHGGA